MGAGTSLGEGIGLQQGANRDDFWAKQIYARGVERKRKREKADEDLIKMGDFKLDYSNKLPVYAKQMAAVQMELMNKVAKARQQNKNTARSVVADDLYRAQLALGKLEQDNARAMAYIADDKTRKDPNVISTLTSPNATFEDIASIHDGQFFMTDATGTFAYKPVPLDYAAPKFDKYSMVGMPTGKRKVVGGTSYNEVIDSYLPEDIEAETNQLAQDRKFQENVLFETRGVKPPEGVDPIEFKKTLVMEKAKEVVNGAIKKGALRYDPRDIDQPREQSEVSKKVKPAIVPFDQKKFNENVKTTTVKNRETGKDEQVATTTLSQGASYSRMANMKPAKNVTIPVTDELIAINPELKDVDAISVTVNNLVEGYNPKGKKEWYGIGMQSDYVAPEEGSMAAVEAEIDGKPITPRKRSSYTPKIPLEMIRQALELAGNDLTEFESQQVETSKPATKQIKSSDISTKARAAGYTEKEYRDLLIKNGVKIID